MYFFGGVEGGGGGGFVLLFVAHSPYAFFPPILEDSL
jgi:galactokinase/mevalonate kinase-like predicted kinase